MNTVQKVLIIEDSPDMQDALKSLVEEVLGSVPVVLMGLNGSVPEKDTVISEIRDGLVLAICDRSLTKNGCEGEELVQTAAKHGAKAVLFSSFIPPETIEKLKELGIPTINKSNTGALIQWIDDSQKE